MQDVPKIVVRRMEAAEALTAAHPDANLLTAFAEQMLTSAERKRVMAHLADCSACRETVMLTTVRVQDELPAAAWPELARRRWFLWPRLGWGFAVAGVAAVAAVGLLRFEQQRHNQQAALAPPKSIAAANQNAPVPGEMSESQKPERDRAPQNRARSTDQSRYQSGDQSDREGAVRNRLSHSNAGSMLPDDKAASTVAARSEAENVSTARNQTSDQLIDRQAETSSPFQNGVNADVVKAKPALSAAPAAAPPASGPVPQLQTPPTLTLKASPQWKVSSEGVLQRSFDAGRTWEIVNVNSASPTLQVGFVFRAVAAVGTEVWAGGTGAMLYHSSDSGARWQQVVPSANGVSASGEIVEIKFSDPENGSLATSTGELWTTSDDGATWRRK